MFGYPNRGEIGDSMSTLKISKDSRFVRAFVWLWEVEKPQELTLCRFFWGTVFFPFAMCSTASSIGRFIPRISLWFAMVGCLCLYIDQLRWVILHSALHWDSAVMFIASAGYLVLWNYSLRHDGVALEDKIQGFSAVKGLNRIAMAALQTIPKIDAGVSNAMCAVEDGFLRLKRNSCRIDIV
jgi:hypothetical protein